MAARVPAQYRIGWNAALRRMHRALVELPGDQLTDTVEIFAQITRGLRLRKPRGGTNTELARKYDVSLRTICNWRAAGCPFARGQYAVLDWLATRRVLPKSVKAKFRKQLDRREWRRMGTELRELMAQTQAERLFYLQHGIPVPEWMQKLCCAFRARHKSPLVVQALNRLQNEMELATLNHGPVGTMSGKAGIVETRKFSAAHGA